MRSKTLALGGILAPIVYVGSVILGGILWPSYSHILQPISDLIATGAPNKALLDPLFALYNLLVLVAGLGLFLFVRENKAERGQLLGTLGAATLVAEGFFGLITLFFPEDAGGMAAGISSTGMLHIVFASLSSLTTMAAILLMGLWFRKSPRVKYGLYSFISVGIVFVSGGMAAAGVASGSAIGGLLERITIGGFMQWLFVIGLMMYSSKAKRVDTSR